MSCRSATTSRCTTRCTGCCRTRSPHSTRTSGTAAVVRRARLDAELVRRGLARSREQAAELIAAGRVLVAGQTAGKPATGVDAATPVLVVDDSGPAYVSRGGHKLAGAFDAFGYDPRGKRALDAGASTGGFTDVLLQRGAA